MVEEEQEPKQHSRGQKGRERVQVHELTHWPYQENFSR